jgi:hypothetical protein
MRRKKKLSGMEGYIIPIAVVVGGGIVVYVVGKNIGLWGSGGSGLAPGSSPTLLNNALALPIAGQATNQQLNITDNISAQTWLNNYASTRGQDCFTNALYVASPGNATLGPGDAQDLYNLIHSQAGTWFSDGDFTGVLAAFQNVVENQTDVSYVASLFQTNDNTDLFTYITKASTFANGTNPAGNNMQLVQQFVQWCIGLPLMGSSP